MSIDVDGVPVLGPIIGIIGVLSSAVVALYTKSVKDSVDDVARTAATRAATNEQNVGRIESILKSVEHDQRETSTIVVAHERAIVPMVPQVAKLSEEIARIEGSLGQLVTNTERILDWISSEENPRRNNRPRRSGQS